MAQEEPQKSVEGSVCRVCGGSYFRTTDTREGFGYFRGKKVGGKRRRRVCQHCFTPKWTFEVDEEILETNGTAVEPAEDYRKSSPKKTPPDQNPSQEIENPYL